MYTQKKCKQNIRLSKFFVGKDPDIISLFGFMPRNFPVFEELDESPDLLRITYHDHRSKTSTRPLTLPLSFCLCLRLAPLLPPSLPLPLAHVLDLEKLMDVSTPGWIQWSWGVVSSTQRSRYSYLSVIVFYCSATTTCFLVFSFIFTLLLPPFSQVLHILAVYFS